MLPLKLILIHLFFSGNVIKPGDVKCILNEGMPEYKNAFEKGKLIIQFSVEFPDFLEPEKVAMLESILPAMPACYIPEDAEEASIQFIVFVYTTLMLIVVV